jgi:hypothetical protein
MDRELLGWSVKRHVVDVSFRELEPPRPTLPDTYFLVGPAGTEDAWDGRLEIPARLPASIDNVRPGTRSGEPSPAL